MAYEHASMRPSAFTDGNWAADASLEGIFGGFNEAVGFHRRKPPEFGCREASPGRFNEAVGFHRRKLADVAEGGRIVIYQLQ